MQKYLGLNGKMYKALIYSSLEVFIEELNGKNITLIDWGCNQGIASMLVLDYIKEKQLDIKVEKVILIDDEEKALSRAIAQVEALLIDKSEIIAINTNDNNCLNKIKNIQKDHTFNLFANNKIPIDFLDIDYDLFDESYFMCLSNENENFINEVYENISIFKDVQNMSIRNDKIGKFKRYERIFKLLKTIDIDIDEDEIPF